MAGREGVEPSRRETWKLAGNRCLRPGVPRRGIEPLSLGRQPSCDASRITREGLLARSRNEPSGLGSPSRDPPGRGDEGDDGHGWRTGNAPVVDSVTASRVRLAPSRHSQRGENRTRSVPARTARASITPLSGAQTWCRPTFSGSSDRRYHWTSSLRAACRAGDDPAWRA
jgi:hypothetical protein